MSQLRAVVQWVPEREGYVARLPDGATLPEWMLRRMGFWCVRGDRGLLSGPDGDRARGEVLFPLQALPSLPGRRERGPAASVHVPILLDGEPCGGTTHMLHEGQDVTDLLGVRLAKGA